MSIVEWFYTIIALVVSYVVLSFPYLVEKLLRVTNKKRGYCYADKELKNGTDPNKLYAYADNQFDFDDFERGMLVRLREHNIGERND